MKEYFVKIESQNRATSEILKTIAKIQALKIWCSKAVSFLNHCENTIKELEICKDMAQRGILIERMESFYISAITTYLRCFHDQPSFHLNIKNVTKDLAHLTEFKYLMTLRNDEFVHWKGLHSSFGVLYSVKVIDPSNIEFAKNIQVNFTYELRVFDTTTTKNLFNMTLQYLEEINGSKMIDLRTKLMDPTIMLKSDFLNPETGLSIFNKT